MGKGKKIVLTIAGSDSSGGAGIQADLKTFNALNIHGTSVITCVTAQNTQKVSSIHKLPIRFIEDQLDTVLEGMKPEAVKTGMLYDGEIVKCVSKKIKKYSLDVVVDPVLVATSNDSLSSNNLVDALKKELLPNAYIFTPNIFEAGVLSGLKICNIDDVKTACKKLHKMGPKYVLVKGGHLEGKDVVDVFYDGKNFSVYSLPGIPNKKAHGSGCTLSALITGFIALDETPIRSVEKSKIVLWNMIYNGYNPGKGSDVLSYGSEVFKDGASYFKGERFDVWFDLKKSVDKLMTILSNELVPEVGINFGYAVSNAKKIDDICGINGRIIKNKDAPIRCGFLGFGYSKHVASIILAALSNDSSFRCVMNIKYSSATVDKCKKLGFKIGSFDRKGEPKNVKSTMEWGTNQVIKNLGFVPDIIFDKGSVGKEPMIRILGKNPEDIVKKVEKIVKRKFYK